MLAKAILLEKNQTAFSCHIQNITEEELLQQTGDTLLQIQYSSLNYKDALAITNTGPVVRQWPMIPGIDGVGTIIHSNSKQYQSGDSVILNGWGCGETHWGCLSQYAYLKSDWLIPLPTNISAQQAMIIGTAGYTAALCVQRIIEHGITPEQGNILITGATGGVGSVAIMLLTQLGYTITAATSKINNTDYLQQLGVQHFIDSKTLAGAGKPLQKEQWAAAIDVLGSHSLANICAQIQYGGIVTACGLAQSMDFPATVAPFILRGITLAGIDSVMAPYPKRIAAWDFLAKNLNTKQLQHIGQIISLNECPKIAQDIINGTTKGRFIVDVNR
ncbi:MULTISPECIES: MDR family oxidoreductase [Snodgrassella]|uniref:acrylyl-CoA reductase (NADPH) n=1 Tax=Snodgrassella TaxID=1193515 RepID=UPI001EF4E2F0|nr:MULTISPECIES: MDR family oxidoreductase [Snodgrassella]MCO6519067.1 oxidoreductase [Snodgrassella sp.]WMY92481.1 oxidoreductase [Snodgrassella communis]